MGVCMKENKVGLGTNNKLVFHARVFKSLEENEFILRLYSKKKTVFEEKIIGSNAVSNKVAEAMKIALDKVNRVQQLEKAIEETKQWKSV